METASRRIVIIGGVAAGATAAARARRLDADASITIVEAGSYVSFANCGLPYFISRDIEKRGALLLQTPEGFKARYNVDVLLHTRATAIDRQARTVSLQGPEGVSSLAYDALILAQGGSPFVPPMDGLDQAHVFRLWTIDDMDRVHAFINENKPSSAVVVGGGFIGLEAAEAFVKRGLSTSIVELSPQLMPPADLEFGAMIARSFREAGARVITGRSVKAIGKDYVTLDDGSRVEAQLALVSAGVKPNTALAQAAGLSVGPSGGLIVDRFMRTEDPSIWAAGDMVEIQHRVSGKPTRVPLAGPANRQGRIAATNALGGSMEYSGAEGTSVFKAMDDTFAQTGLSEKAARALGLDAGVSVVHRYHHVGYYPGAKELSLKLVYDKGSGRLLGAQAFGPEGVDKRIDVAATAIAGGMGIDDLAELDLTYAPPYGAANDPINMAAFAAQNDRSGYAPLISATKALELARKGAATIVDVRTNGERRKLDLGDFLHIPADELSWRMDELPAGKVMLLSRAGYESHIALRAIVQSGRADVYNIAGGALSVALLPEFQDRT